LDLRVISTVTSVAGAGRVGAGFTDEDVGLDGMRSLDAGLREHVDPAIDGSRFERDVEGLVELHDVAGELEAARAGDGFQVVLVDQRLDVKIRRVARFVTQSLCQLGARWRQALLGKELADEIQQIYCASSIWHGIIGVHNNKECPDADVRLLTVSNQ